MKMKGKLKGWKEILSKSLIQRQMLKDKVKSEDKPQCRSCGSQLQSDAQLSGTADRNSETDDTHAVDGKNTDRKQTAIRISHKYEL